MCHLDTRSFEPTLDVESLIDLTAIQDSLITPDVFRNVVQCLNHFQAQLLALLVLRDRYILNVSDYAKIVDA